MTTSTDYTLADVEKVIRTAGERQGWKMKPLGAGEMQGVYSRSRRVAVVEIRYRTTSFTVDYKDSTNLKYNGDSIHAIYNTWVQKLETAIRREASIQLP